MDSRAVLNAGLRAPLVTLFLFFSTFSCLPAGAEESPGDSLMPDFYDDAMLSTSGISLEDYESSSVDYFSGRMTRSATDVSIPGNGGMALSVIRSYQSQQPYKLPEPTAVGVGWNMHFGWVEISDISKMCNPLWSVSVVDNPVVHLPDGSTDVLAMTGLPLLDPTLVHYRGKGGLGVICGPALGGETFANFILVDAQGKRYELERWSDGGAVVGFDKTAKWFVRRITDRHGNWQWIDYARLGDGNTQLVAPTRVTTSDGRDIQFDYAGTTLTRIRYGNEVLVEYEYAPSGSGSGFFDLVRVVLREELVWHYTYSGKGDPGAGSMLTSTNPFGGVTSYTWQEVFFQTGDGKEPNAAVSRVVQDAAGSPSATWLYAYTPAAEIGDRDVTTVQAPEGVYTYHHHSALGMRSGEVWMVGLKDEVYFRPADGGPLRRENFEWQNYCISPENYKRVKATGVWAALDENYWGATLWWHEIVIDGAAWATVYGQWDWNPGYVGQPAAQTVITLGPGNNRQELNRRFQHREEINLHFLVHQEWITQEAFPGMTPVQTDYDSLGNPVRKFDRGFYTFLEWDAQGNLASMTRGLSGDREQGDPRVTRYRNYFRGVAGETVHPDGTISRTDVDAFGRTLAATDREGIQTRYAYDGMGRVTFIDYPQGNDTTVSYAGTRTVLQRGDYRKQTRTDGLGRAVEEAHADLASGRSMSVIRQYDDRGQVVFSSYPNSATQGMRYLYDSNGRVVRVSHPGGERMYRHIDGSHTEVIDENGAVTRLYRRELAAPGKGELVRIESPENIVTTIERNEYGLPLRVSQGDGVNMTVRSNTYNSSLVLLASHDPESGEKTYGYDWAGNLSVIRRQDGVAGPVDHHYNLYDVNDRLVTTWAPTNEVLLDEGEKQSLDVRLEFGWTPEGRPLAQSRHETIRRWRDDQLVAQQFRNSTWQHEYDANGNTTGERVDIDGIDAEFAYAWDGNDRLASITYPDGHVLAYDPDAFGWPTRAGGYASAVDYHETGQLAGFTFGSGQRVALTVNDRFLIAGIRLPGVVDLGYGYDPAGNVVQVSDARDASGNVALGYDDMNRLVMANGPWGVGTFAYDVLGNITQKEIGDDRLTLMYDAGNRLVAQQGSRARQYGYDGFGNLAMRDATRLGYDGLGNLMSVIEVSGIQQAQYQYDARGRRIATIKDGHTSYSLQGNGDHLLYEFDVAAETARRNVYLGNIQVAYSETFVACYDDIDGDGIPHCTETEAGLDPRDGSDAGGDRDGDSLSNIDEYRLGTGINDADSDNDGMADGLEVYFGLNPKVADADADLDGDGLPNSVELARGFDPSNPADGQADSDADGLSNAAEFTLGTAWNDADTDNDAMPDGYEVAHGLNPRVNDAAGDADGDGMSNGFEYSHGYDPADPADGSVDSDGDGLTDGEEIEARTNPNVADTDFDGIDDGVEVANGMNPVAKDANSDLDGDGLPNAWELQHGLKPNDPADALADPDGDGRSTLVEYNSGSNPFGADPVRVPDDLVLAPSSTRTLLAWSPDPLATSYNLRWGVLGEAGNLVTDVRGAYAVPTLAETLYWFQVEARHAAGSTYGSRKATIGGVRSDAALPYALAAGCTRTQLEVVGDGAFFLACERGSEVFVHRFGKGVQPAAQAFPVGAAQAGKSGWRFAASLSGEALLVWLDDANTLMAARFDAASMRWLNATAVETHAFEVTHTGYPCDDGDALGLTCRLYEVYAFDIHPDWRGQPRVYYAVNAGYAGNGAAKYALHRVWFDAAGAQREYIGEQAGRPVILAVGSPEQAMVVTNSAGSQYAKLLQTVPGAMTSTDLGYHFGSSMAFDRQVASWSGSKPGAYGISGALLCGSSCSPLRSELELSPSERTWAFGGQSDGQAFWFLSGAIRYAKVAKNSKGVYAWGRPASLAADTRLLDPEQVRLARGETSASFYWSNSASEIRHVDIRPDASWSAQTLLPVSGRLADVGSDWAGNVVVAIEKDGSYQFRERRRLPSTQDVAADTTAPVVSWSSQRGGKTSITHVVTLSANEPANIFFSVTGGSITAGGINMTAEQRYQGPVTITFPKGGSARVTFRAINLAQQWSGAGNAMLQ